MSFNEDTKANLRLIKIIFFLLLYLHSFGCVWWLVVSNEREWVPYMYTDKEDMYEFYDADFLHRYLVALHASVQCSLGQDIAPRDPLQGIIAIIGLI